MKISRQKHDFDIESITVDSQNPGTHLLILGVVHGNEPCGLLAAEKIISECEKGERQLKNGKITFVPVCNPRAFARNVRETDENLNRVFYKEPRSNSYEAKIAPVLCSIIEKCDVVLDIHSYRAQTPPFVMNDYANNTTNAWVEALSLHNVIIGWTDLYPEGGGTLDYADECGQFGLCIECGQHTDETVVQTAYTMMDETIAFWKIGEKLTDEPKQRPLDIGLMVKLIHRPDETAQLIDGMHNFMPFDVGDVLYTSEKENFCAPFNGFIVMPKPGAAVGKEWFYLARKMRDI